jgi:periplasmic copper chaperone A
VRNLFLLAAIVLAMAACTTAEPQEAASETPMAEMEGVVAVNARANMTLPSDTGSIWLEIQNHTAVDDALVGAEFEGCTAIELHDMTMENDVMVMREVEGGKIPIPAGGRVELKQGGLHIMCIGKEAPLEAGSTLDVTLLFENAQPVHVTAVVVEPGDTSMDMEGGEHSEMDMDSE